MYPVLFASVLMAQDFPDWKTSETRRATAWKNPPSDTLEGALFRDSLGRQWRSTRLDSLIWLNIRLHPILSAVMWPVEKVVTPMGRYMLEPLREPALYAEREEITDRGVRLVQLDSAGNTMLYPTMVMDGSTASRLGGTFINGSLLGKGSYTRLGGALMINRDWYASLNLSLPPQTDLDVVPGVRFYSARSGEQAVWIPGQVPIGSGGTPATVWEGRQNVELSVTYPMAGFGAIQPTVRYLRREVRDPIRKAGKLDSLPDIKWFEHGDRGVMGGDESWIASGFVWGHGNVNYEGTPSEGGTETVSLLRTWNDGGGDALNLNLDMTHYFLIGEERYAYRKGDLDPYLKFSPNTILTLLDPSTLRQRLTQRRILALQLTARRMWEVNPKSDPVSYFNFPSYGGDAPARAYSGRRLMDHALVGGALEYRWPIWRYIDGSLFAEAAWAGSEWWDVNETGVAPGWGVGLRFRTPHQFLFRGQAAFGLEGPHLIVTVSPEF